MVLFMLLFCFNYPSLPHSRIQGQQINQQCPRLEMSWERGPQEKVNQPENLLKNFNDFILVVNSIEMQIQNDNIIFNLDAIENV